MVKNVRCTFEAVQLANCNYFELEWDVSDCHKGTSLGVNVGSLCRVCNVAGCAPYSSFRM
jgi:hypothetical protein